VNRAGTRRLHGAGHRAEPPVLSRTAARRAEGERLHRV
ncbi:MAG: hypothetical protein AVDCRST_MAG13-3619, partial [uncultured Solirubrobacteraceae bacterium]